MKVLVSACIMGENCKYNGKNNKNSAAIHFLKDKEVISICPEVLAGMETPRPCAEIVNGRVVDENGNDVSLEYNKAVAVALSKIQNEEIDLVILQSRSPTLCLCHDWFICRAAPGRNSCSAMGFSISGYGYSISDGKAGMAHRTQQTGDLR